jgi:hypothetical protein
MNPYWPSLAARRALGLRLAVVADRVGIEVDEHRHVRDAGLAGIADAVAVVVGEHLADDPRLLLDPLVVTARDHCTRDKHDPFHGEGLHQRSRSPRNGNDHVPA